MSEFETLDWERDGAIARITLNRPKAANGLNPAMGRDLVEVAGRCADPSVRAVVLTGAGRFFSAGGDLNILSAGGQIRESVKALADELHKTMAMFARMDAPLVVAVNGVAAGAGFSVAISGDLVLAAESATFTMAYTRAGLSPDGGATYHLPRLVGLRRAQELILTNRTLTAAEAADWGLVNRVVPDAELPDAATELAGRLAAGPRGSHAAVRRLLLASFGNSLQQQMDLEAETIAACADSPEGREGMAAFLEKRRPTFA